MQELPGILSGGNEGEGSDKHADTGHGEAGLGVGDQQDHRQEEDAAAQGEIPPVGDGTAGVRTGDGQDRLLAVVLPQLLMEAEVEIEDGGHQGDGGNETGVGDEVPKGVPQGGADDDVGRVPAHGSGAPQVGAENLREDHGNWVKAQELGQLHRHRRQEEDHGDAVDEHG